MNSCLFDRYAFEHRMRQCSQTWQELSSHPGEGRELLFPGNCKSFRSQKTTLYFELIGWQHSLVSKNYLTGIRDHTKDTSSEVFDGVEFESGLHLAEILLVSSEPIGIDILEKSLTSMGFLQKQSWRGF